MNEDKKDAMLTLGMLAVFALAAYGLGAALGLGGYWGPLMGAAALAGGIVWNINR